MSEPSKSKGRSRTDIRIESKLRVTRALQLRALRWSYERIAQECGYANRGSAYRAIKAELRAIPRDEIAEERLIALETLDVAQRGVARQIARGHLGAIDRLIRLMDHRAKLLGLYEPQADSGIAEVAAVLGAWLGKVREEDEALDADLPDQEPQTPQAPPGRRERSADGSRERLRCMYEVQAAEIRQDP